MDLVEWLESQGGKVAPELKIEYSPHKGNYITGSSFRPGQLLIEVPASLLVNIKTLGVTEKSHENLARYLYNTQNTWTKSILPIQLAVVWLDKDIDRLPPKYRRRVLEQRQQIKQQHSQDQDIEQWVEAWSSVNSRCLYWDVGLDRPDQMTLAPLIDFFNHSTDPSNCITIKNKLGKMCAYAPNTAGSGELNLFYGPHENGFLLVEYGFVAENNQWDYIDITAEISALGINTVLLESLDYSGNYTLNSDGPCFRTMVALSSITATPKQVERYSQGIDDMPGFDQYLSVLYQNLKQRYTIQPDDRPEIKALYTEYQKILNGL